MMNSELKCGILGHQEKIVFICTNPNCQNQRGLCAICIQEEIHHSDLNFNKSHQIKICQLQNILQVKEKHYDATIKEAELLIENFRAQFKNIQEEILQIIKQEEQKVIDLKESKSILDQYINQIQQQSIDNKYLSDLVTFYSKHQVKKIKDSKIKTLLEKINHLFKEYNQKKIKLIQKEKDQTKQLQENQKKFQQNSVSHYYIPQNIQPSNFQYELNNPQSLIMFNNQQQKIIANNQIGFTQPQQYSQIGSYQQFQQITIQKQEQKQCKQSVDHRQNIIIASISPNNLMIASSDAENLLLLWNTIELKADQKYSHPFLIRALCFSEDSKYLFMGDDKGFINIFDLNVRLEVKIYQQLSTSPIIAIFVNDNNIIAQDMKSYLYNCQEKDQQIICKYFETNHPYKSEDELLLSSRDYCNQSQIYAFTNQKTIYLYLQLFSSFQKVITQQLDKWPGQIVFQQKSSQNYQLLNIQLVTTYIDMNEIQIWSVGQELIKQQLCKLDGFPLNISLFNSSIIYETQNQLSIFFPELNMIRKVADIPQLESHQRRFYDTKQSKNPSYHICLRSNVLILIENIL